VAALAVLPQLATLAALPQLQLVFLLLFVALPPQMAAITVGDNFDEADGVPIGVAMTVKFWEICEQQHKLCP
jgi:hypothetical protein